MTPYGVKVREYKPFGYTVSQPRSRTPLDAKERRPLSELSLDGDAGGRRRLLGGRECLDHVIKKMARSNPLPIAAPPPGLRVGGGGSGVVRMFLSPGRLNCCSCFAWNRK